MINQGSNPPASVYGAQVELEAREAVLANKESELAVAIENWKKTRFAFPQKAAQAVVDARAAVMESRNRLEAAKKAEAGES